MYGQRMCLLMLVVMLAKPHSASAIHHHGEEGMAVLNCDALCSHCRRITFAIFKLWADAQPDTIVYAVSGRGAIVSENGKKRQELGPGDFALIPAFVGVRLMFFLLSLTMAG